MKRKRKDPEQFELPITKDAFNLIQETTPAPKDDAGPVYVIRARRGEETWLAYDGLKMTREQAEITAQACRKIWKEVSYTVEKTTP